VANSTYESLAEHDGPDTSLPEAALTELAPAIRFRVIAKAAAGVGGQQPSYQRLLAAEALLRRKGSAGPVELPGGVSVYRLSLAELQDRERAQGLSGTEGVPREAARCGKLIFRLHKPSRK
jgi:tRNA(Ile)-lysidine synthase